SDPGIGAATAVTVAVADTVNLPNEALNVQSLTPGFHILGIRFKNQDGNWSLTEGKTFYRVPPVQQVDKQIVKAEYFFGNTDPGVGNGFSTSISPGRDTVLFFNHPGVNALSSGQNKITVRFQNAAGEWSLSESQFFDVSSVPVPVLNYPVNNSRVYTLTPTLAWQDYGQGYSYDLAIFNINSSATFDYVYQQNNIASTTFTIPSEILSNCSRYDMYLRAHDGQTTTDWSKIRSFRTSYIPISGIANNYCTGDDFSMTFTVCPNEQFDVFKVQLSDGTGNFANSRTIGSVEFSDGTTGYSFHSAIPLNIPDGSNYRIRLTDGGGTQIGINGGGSIAIVNPHAQIVNFTSHSLCELSQFPISFTANNCFNSSNTFTVQLSNSSGNFANPVNIGKLAGNSSGTISCDLPAGITIGSGYRFRIHSSAPEAEHTDNGFDIAVNPLPVPVISGNSAVCAVNIENFSAVTPEGTVNNWIISGGAIQGSGSGSQISVLWGTSGAGNVKLIQTTIAGCKDSTSMNIQINNLPAPSISGNSVVCADNIYEYSANTKAEVSNFWKVSGGEISGSNSGNNVIIVWRETASGTITLIQTIAASGCLDSASLIVNINPLPVISINGNTSVCANNPEIYSSNTAAGTENVWIVSGGSITGANTGLSVNIQWGSASAGLIKLVKTITSTGCKDSVEMNIVINPLPVPGITGSTAVAAYSSQNYNAGNPTGMSNFWFVSGGSINGSNTGATISITWGSGPAGIVKLVQTNTATLCKDSIQKDILVCITGSSQVSCRLYLHGLWNGSSHKAAPVMLELRSGSALMSSTVVSRKAGILDASGQVSLDFSDIPDGFYYLVVRTGGYLPLAILNQITLPSCGGIAHDFTTSSTQSVAGANVMILANGVYQVRAGDFNQDIWISTIDLNTYLKASYGRQARSSIPAP
ncbi:MAG: hypothetical protein QG635_2130, partial [Bacteroidota bacterium]|nr:hypothetical protein [Bacteroidota bacterium]